MGYYEDQRPDSLRLVVRFILIAGLCSGVATMVGAFASLMVVWPQMWPSAGLFLLYSMQGIYNVMQAAVFCAAIAASVGCVVFIYTRSGRAFTIWSEIALIALKACATAITVVRYISIYRQPNLPPFYVASQLMQMAAAFVVAAVCPALVVLVLVQKDLRRLGITEIQTV